ncbi:hypothetical protein PPL_05342 [Heterostelium album PN500]|uniref:Vesicle transport protein n=1 Tax=Heterostelium pallidum (strain ATCC 26659 / Pp 5 / PN500) TaxID=670386 RepID=D3B9X2_HETP5|nr:hypothetical protein PPL_05342 [Heterostelium album PN500]EFA81359.1 hypothetical protein PPL_05342 [Heterostelium album PN500]|eukprot:XP_020433477.1 hypothetical protein PPL_05342 [Heterostelium album PN500]
MSGSTNSYSLDNLEFKTNQSFLSSTAGSIGSETTQYWNDISESGGSMFSKISGKITSVIPGINNANKPNQQPTFYEEVQQQTSFSYIQRLTLFAITLLIGIALIVMSTFFVFSPRTFAKLYTLGSLSVIVGLIVLVGLKKQFENITSSKERLYSSLIYLVSIVGTLYCALSLQSTFLSMFMVVLQFLSVVWYSLSYIPFGQAILQKII